MGFFSGVGDFFSSSLGSLTSSILGGLLGAIEQPKAPKVIQSEEPTKAEVDASVIQARLIRRRRSAASGGRRSTIATSAQGLLSKQSADKSLLGT